MLSFRSGKKIIKRFSSIFKSELESSNKIRIFVRDSIDSIVSSFLLARIFDFLMKDYHISFANGAQGFSSLDEYDLLIFLGYSPESTTWSRRKKVPSFFIDNLLDKEEEIIEKENITHLNLNGVPISIAIARLSKDINKTIFEDNLISAFLPCAWFRYNVPKISSYFFDVKTKKIIVPDLYGKLHKNLGEYLISCPFFWINSEALNCVKKELTKRKKLMKRPSLEFEGKKEKIINFLSEIVCSLVEANFSIKKEYLLRETFEMSGKKPLLDPFEQCYYISSFLFGNIPSKAFSFLSNLRYDEKILRFYDSSLQESFRIIKRLGIRRSNFDFVVFDLRECQRRTIRDPLFLKPSFFDGKRGFIAISKKTPNYINLLLHQKDPNKEIINRLKNIDIKIKGSGKFLDMQIKEKHLGIVFETLQKI